MRSERPQKLEHRGTTRVAVVGSGPAGFYSAELLLKETRVSVDLDMFDRLPTPFGLVRFGVAPDHESIKRASKAFERTAAHPRFRFFGNVEVGRDISIEELLLLYDQVLVATGSASDRRLEIPGEDLPGSHAATEFVGWYNGHPDFAEHQFNLATPRAVVVGMGNVAMDVTRVLVRQPEELAKTDIASYALDAFRKSQVREVVLLGRRGPAQAAFEQRELQDIAELEGVSVYLARPIEAEEPGESLSASSRKILDYLRTLPTEPDPKAERRVCLRFLGSPRMIFGSTQVEGLEFEHNRLVVEEGNVKAIGTGVRERTEAGLVMRSIGYKGVPIPGLPFDAKRGVVPNDRGRVQNGEQPLAGLYAVGWIKRGPTGLIGSNKVDARETVGLMLEDAMTQENPAKPLDGQAKDVVELLTSRGVRFVSFEEWQQLDELERSTGKRLGKIREKFYSLKAMLSALRSGTRLP